MTQEKREEGAGDGGPAFARPYSRDPQHYQDPESYPSQEGMTLRDYFAAKALQGELAAQGGGESWADKDALARRCFAIADAMIKARG